jgi:uncharacterized protein (DUF1015 family)
MPDVRPFRGIRYSSPTELANLVCPPFDVISEAEQDQLYLRDPHNAIRLELPKKADGAQGDYADVCATFHRWLDDGVLRQDPADSLYIYRQDFADSDGRRRRVAGVLGALALEAFGAQSGVLPHERTMPGPKEDRLALLRACPANFSPIYAIYRGGRGLAPYLDALQHRPPAARFVGAEEILHRLWVIDAPAEIAMLRSAISASPLVIADGHHRYETALSFYQENPQLEGAGSIMCFCVDADAEELVVLPYHRVLRTQAQPAEIKRRAIERFGAQLIAPEDAPRVLARSSQDHAFALILADDAVLVEKAHRSLHWGPGEHSDAWRRLDVVALHDSFLATLLPEGIDDLTFTKDPAEVRALVRNEGWTAGVLLRAVEPSQIVDVATSGERMPQKASYFWPKAITGLVLRSLQ